MSFQTSTLTASSELAAMIACFHVSLMGASTEARNLVPILRCLFWPSQSESHVQNIIQNGTPVKLRWDCFRTKVGLGLRLRLGQEVGLGPDMASGTASPATIPHRFGSPLPVGLGQENGSALCAPRPPTCSSPSSPGLRSIADLTSPGH